MYRYKIYSIAFLALVSPLSLFAAEGGFGEGMSRDFYSEIERGHYTLQQQMMDTRLSSYPDLAAFVRSCGIDVTLKPGTKVDATLLRQVNQGDISGMLSGVDTTGGFSTEQEAALRKCLVEKRSRLVEAIDEQVSTIHTLSSIGVYTDGSLENSDYDLLDDIAKIDAIIFKADAQTPYVGSQNLVSLSLLDLLAGKKPKTIPLSSLVSGSALSGGDGNNTTISPPSSSSGSTTASGLLSTQSGGSSQSLDSFLGACVAPTGAGFSLDDDFFSELDRVTQYGGDSRSSGGVGGIGAVSTQSGGSLSEGSLSGGVTLPELPDFFHNSACWKKDSNGKNISINISICAKINFVMNQTRLESGGGDLSIEALITKRLSELEEIAAYNLGAQVMTKGFFQSPKPGYQFWQRIAGMRTFIYDKPQTKKQFSSEENPQARYDRQWNCAAESAGLLSTDPVKALGPRTTGFMNTEGSDTRTIIPRNVPLGTIDKSYWTSGRQCLDQEVTLARRQYYQTFSSELSEILSFTDAFLAELQKSMALVGEIEKKGTQR